MQGTASHEWAGCQCGPDNLPLRVEQDEDSASCIMCHEPVAASLQYAAENVISPLNVAIFHPSLHLLLII